MLINLQTTGYCEIFTAKIAFIFIAKAYFVCSALFHPSLRHTPRWRCSVHKFCYLVGEGIASNPLVIQTREPKYIDRLHMIFFQFLPCRLLFRFYASPKIRLDLITWMPWQDCCHLADTSIILICNPISHLKKVTVVIYRLTNRPLAPEFRVCSSTDFFLT